MEHQHKTAKEVAGKSIIAENDSPKCYVMLGKGVP
jgi:hypothetical protein